MWSGVVHNLPAIMIVLRHMQREGRDSGACISAQLVVERSHPAVCEEALSLPDTQRGQSGFGSSDLRRMVTCTEAGEMFSIPRGCFFFSVSRNRLMFREIVFCLQELFSVSKSCLGGFRCQSSGPLQELQEFQEAPIKSEAHS